MDFSGVKSWSIPEGAVKKVQCGSVTLWEKIAAQTYQYITPIDPVSFPVLNNYKLLILDGTENWRSVSTGYYTSDFSSFFSGVSRTDLRAFSEHWEFDPTVMGGGDLANEMFMFNGTSSKPVNGNITFKNSYTAQDLSAWTDYLTAHHEKILIPLNSSMADGSVWKPAKDTNGATGYWDGESGFVSVYGGIPYYGDNLITQDIIDNYYQAYFASSGSNRYWRPATDSSRTIRLDVEAGKYYGAKWDETDSDIVGAVYRLGYTNDGTPKASTGNMLYNVKIWTPQDNPDEVLTATKKYMVIQIGGALFPGNVEHLTVREMIGYKPPNLLMGGNPFYPLEPNPDEPDSAEE